MRLRSAPFEASLEGLCKRRRRAQDPDYAAMRRSQLEVAKALRIMRALMGACLLIVFIPKFLRRMRSNAYNVSFVTRLRVSSFSISLDGYGAGPEQSVENPLGVGGFALHQWSLATRTWRQMHGEAGGSVGVDEEFAARGFDNVGAWILGRNMFGPVRGPWRDDSWKGWWGDSPPYHTPVFVLTHHGRPSLPMAGGTTFHFVTDGVDAALERAREAADGKDIRIGGGVATIQQFLRAGLLDELHLALAPVLLGAGERFFSDLNLPKLGYRCAQVTPGELATHILLLATRLMHA